MSGVVEWVKNYSMIFLLMTILSSVVAKKEYRKYIQLFIEIVLIITLVNPLLKVTGRSEDLFHKISFDSFWQGIEEMKRNQDKLDFLDEKYYITYYENAIETDVKLLAKDTQYVITDAKVTMNSDYEVEKMKITVAKNGEDTVIIGNIGQEASDAQISALKEKIANYYQMDIKQITIIN